MPASACPDTGAVVPTNLSVLLITSTPLDHIRRNGEWSFRDTLLSRRLPHPLRVYFDYRGRRKLPPPAVPNVTWVNLTAVQPWAQAVVDVGSPAKAALQLAYRNASASACFVGLGSGHAATCRDIFTVLKVAALYDAVLRPSPPDAVLWLDSLPRWGSIPQL
tara:strand:- start:396 stop:881 length:486 start_codon:yes stop_codon:yes gene_type:complete